MGGLERRLGKLDSVSSFVDAGVPVAPLAKILIHDLMPLLNLLRTNAPRNAPDA